MGDRELDQRIWNGLKGRSRARPPADPPVKREVPADVPNYSSDLREALGLKDLIASKDQDRPGL